MERRTLKWLRWIASVIATSIGGGLAYVTATLLLALALGGTLGFLRLLLAAYGALAAGYVFTAAVTRLAPGRRYVVSVVLVFVTVIVAAALMLGRPSDQDPLVAVLLGTSLVVGAFGHALKVRGFNEALSSRDG